MRLLLDAILVPHAPVLLPQVNGRGGDSIRETLGELTIPKDRPIILVSPHGSADLVYGHADGDLSGLGIPGVDVARSWDEKLAADLASTWHRSMSNAPLDHGSVVPALLMDLAGPLVPVALAEEGADPEAAPSLARAIASVTSDTSALVIASAHGAAALSPRAPLTERPAGHELQGEIDAALSTDVAGLLEVDDDLWNEGGCCSRSVLSLLGHLFGGRRFEIEAGAEPFGVAYRVGRLA